MLDELVEVTFIRMIGDPVSNSGGWNFPKLSQVSEFENGDRSSNYPSGEDIQSEGVLFLNTKNIVNSKLNLSETQCISEDKFRALTRGKARRNDLIITLRGTLGSCFIFDCDYETAFINAQMMIIRPRSSELSPAFLHAVLTSKRMKEHLMVISTGAAVPQLTAAHFSALQVPVPPVEIQNEFFRRVAAVERLRRVNFSALAQLEELFATLQLRAFRGELWRQPAGTVQA